MYTIAALYHFTRFDDPAALKPPLLALCVAQGVKGTLLLAGEGVNGTIAGPRPGHRRRDRASARVAGVRGP